MRIFLTGATGVVGRRVIPQLIELGHEITAIGRTLEKRGMLERAGARATAVSLFDVDALGRAVAGHDVVINLATHVPRSALRLARRSAWAENDRIRRYGSENLVECALAGGARWFVQESYAPAYPDERDGWIDETSPMLPEPYNRSVLDAERSALRFAGEGRSSVILRFASFYGPDARLLMDATRWVARGFAPLPGDPDAFMSSISHDDAASAVIAVLGMPSGVYNVADDEPVTHREYFTLLAAALGMRAPRLPPPWTTFLFGGPGKLLARSQRISNRKLRDASDWRPRYPSVREGFRALGAAWRRPTTPRPQQRPLAGVTPRGG